MPPWVCSQGQGGGSAGPAPTWCSFAPIPYFSLISVFPVFSFPVSCPLCPQKPVSPLSPCPCPASFPLCRGSVLPYPSVPTALSLLLVCAISPPATAGASLGIPVFHEYRHFFPICPFSLWMKTKTFELEINFKHLPTGEASLGTLGLLCQASITFAPKEKMGELE